MPSRPIAERFHELFRGFEGAHGTHGDPPVREPSGKWPIKPVARTVKEPVTVELVERHLSGDYPLGIVPVRSDGSASWGSIDIDEYGPDVFQVVAAVEAARLPLIPVRSKSGGVHLFSFLAEPRPAAELRPWLERVAEAIGHKGAEVFPKQDTPRDAGSWILLPYFGSTYGGKLQTQVGLKKGGGSMSLTEFLMKAEKARVPPGALPRVQLRARPVPGSGGAIEMMPCLAAVVRDGWSEGERNDILMQFGIFAKRAYPAEWTERLEAFNRERSPPLPAEEVVSTITSLKKSQYEYFCQHPALKLRCQKTACLRLPFGVGGGAGAAIDIEAIVEVPSDPKRWRLTIGGKVVEVGARELNNFPRFNEAAITQLRRSFPPLRASVWSEIVDGALLDPDRFSVGELPVDLTSGAAFCELLTDFLHSMSKGRRRDDIVLGRPWEATAGDDGVPDEIAGLHWFRLGDLMRFLDRERSKLSRYEAAAELRKIGGRDRVLKIRGKATACWAVPVGNVEGPGPAPEDDAPIMPSLSVIGE
jgi:hypothetical protein